jgi:hypothetical protein
MGHPCDVFLANPELYQACLQSSDNAATYPGMPEIEDTATNWAPTGWHTDPPVEPSPSPSVPLPSTTDPCSALASLPDLYAACRQAVSGAPSTQPPTPQPKPQEPTPAKPDRSTELWWGLGLGLVAGGIAGVFFGFRK